MTKPWNPRVIIGGRTSPHTFRPVAIRRRQNRPRRSRVTFAELRLMVLAGVFLGLGHEMLTEGGAHRFERSVWIPGESVSVADPWAAHAIDGDTFAYRGARFRILGIDTPETEAQCPEESEAARRATRRMQDLLGAGPFDIESGLIGQDRDRYGRLLRRVTRGGESLGATMISEGLARPYHGGARGSWCA